MEIADMPTTKYIWDYDNDSLLMEKDDAGSPVATYTSEPVQYGDLISQRRGAITSYYHCDGLGSTRALTDSVQDTTDTAIYGASGGTVTRTGRTTNPFGYVGSLGYYADSDTGDHYVRQRMYRSSLSRWLSVDPIGRSHTYAYSANRPVNLVDPSGLKEVPSGVRLCKGFSRGGLFSETGLMASHWFIVIDGEGVGRFEVNLNVCGTAEVRRGDLDTYPIDECRSKCWAQHKKCQERYGGRPAVQLCGRRLRACQKRCGFIVDEGEFYSVCLDFLIEDCCNDKDKFLQAIRDYIAGQEQDPGTYVAIGRSCRDFVFDALEEGLANSRTGSWWGCLGVRYSVGDIYGIPVFDW